MSSRLIFMLNERYSHMPKLWSLPFLISENIMFGRRMDNKSSRAMIVMALIMMLTTIVMIKTVEMSMIIQ